MAKNDVGEARRSHCIGNFGPGAIVEFRTGGRDSAALSAVVAGLDEWDRYAPPAGLQHPQVTYERRLQRLLDVDGFRLPPVDPENRGQRLVARRFPNWLQCPVCHRLRMAAQWDRGGPGDPACYCSWCTTVRNKVAVVPVRFVAACMHGHLQEFPWDNWVRHAPGCARSDLRLFQSSRAGLSGLVVRCETCKQENSMEGAFGKNTMRSVGYHCVGNRPWLNDREVCDQFPRAVQRGASNLYFPLVASALAIPPFTDAVQVALDPYLRYFRHFADEAKWPSLIESHLMEQDLGLSADRIIAEVRRALQLEHATGIAKIRLEEYEKLSSDSLFSDQVDFDIRPETVPPELARYFDRVVRVVRLREVRAIRGFTRIVPPAGELEDDAPSLAAISADENRRWLPAIEVRGEGIFVRLNLSRLKQWEQEPELVARAARINTESAKAWHERHGPDSAPPRTITPRFLLVHSLAHALVRQLTVSSGYSSASLRERLYADLAHDTAGILIYTGSADSDGSLGGLERQGKPDRFRALVPEAIRALAWCSNDPLCIQDISTFSDPQNGAACHSCLMAPETSCEEFNLLLDRAMLVGLPGNRNIGFFSALLDATSDI